jgi:hypothetical protein
MNELRTRVKRLEKKREKKEFPDFEFCWIGGEVFSVDDMGPLRSQSDLDVEIERLMNDLRTKGLTDEEIRRKIGEA